MSEPTPHILHDRGLGTAYERYCFYQRMEAWAGCYGIESLLEGPVDGMAGIAGVHGVGLARRGIPVVSAHLFEKTAARAREVYAAAAPNATVQFPVLASVRDVSKLPKADMVVCYHAIPFVDDPSAVLEALAKLARMVLIVTVCNPDNWGVMLVRGLGRMRGLSIAPPPLWHTKVLAPMLWKVGRVREHVYFDAPWWPDLPVAAGQTLHSRLVQLFTRKDSVRFRSDPSSATLSERFVFGPEKWPYFGGAGWMGELLPALLKHPGFDGISSPLLAPRLAHLHAFVVDTQGRKRKLETVG
jgi:hypothetical protein